MCICHQLTLRRYHSQGNNSFKIILIFGTQRHIHIKSSQRQVKKGFIVHTINYSVVYIMLYNVDETIEGVNNPWRDCRALSQLPIWLLCGMWMTWIIFSKSILPSPVQETKETKGAPDLRIVNRTHHNVLIHRYVYKHTYIQICINHTSIIYWLY